MSDTLLYRLPGGKVVEFTGIFQSVESLNNLDGFIIESFDKKHKFHFLESDGESEFASKGEIKGVQSHEDYLHDAGLFLEALQNRGIKKSVFARAKKVPFKGSPRQLFYRLCESYPNAFVYLVSSPLFGCWIGASPELLLESAGGQIRTVALAGTKAVDSEEKWNDKEVEEQECVQLFIRESLNDIGIDLYNEDSRKEIIAGPVKHLVSSFTFSSSIDPVELAEMLHPTPAVSGLPRNEALDIISKYEKIDRSLYAGFLGINKEGSCQLFVNLRCAELCEDAAYLYVGGGFTKDSVVEDEWNETEHKAQTLQRIIED